MTNKIKKEKPARGILLQNDWGNSKRYHVPCDCSEPNHSHDVWVTSDDVFTTVTIHTKIYSKWDTNRFKQIWTLLTKGYIEAETDLLLNAEQANNYSAALKKACRDVVKNRKNKKVL